MFLCIFGYHYEISPRITKDSFFMLFLNSQGSNVVVNAVTLGC